MVHVVNGEYEGDSGGCGIWWLREPWWWWWELRWVEALTVVKSIDPAPIEELEVFGAHVRMVLEGAARGINIIWRRNALLA